ncbi:MAG TPA: alginate lyase family protein [Dongiaceae bacterium]
MDLGWYFRRLRRMSASEIASRLRAAAIQQAWRFGGTQDRFSRSASPLAWTGASPAKPDEPYFRPVDPAAKARLLAAAHAIMNGHWRVFGHNFDTSIPDPDWHRDIHTGKRFAPDRYCFDVPYRDVEKIGDVKSIWEPSRLHHVTVLAAAYRLSGEERFAQRAADHLQSWWKANPPLRGVHWLSGIELGMRLIAWVWTRRLLAEWPGVGALFEGNPAFRLQLFQHERWLAALHSRGSSANNHLIAEAAGLFMAATAFGGPAEQERWARLAAGILEQEIVSQTFPDGFNRELAFGYHGYALGLFMLAALEGEAAERPMSDDYWRIMSRMADAMAANLGIDATGATPRCIAPRQGDGDDAHALMLDAPGDGAWPPLLDLCGAALDALPWWPDPVQPSVLAALGAPLARGRAMAQSRRAEIRPAGRPHRFAEAGVTFLRDEAETPRSICCRVDHGPHGFLSTAAHGHADALSFELSIGGHPILIDPGTYCYQSDPSWRRYFRSTIAHNTLELGGVDQAIQAGLFLWSSQPTSWLESATGIDHGEVAELIIAHDGYRRLEPRATHIRHFRYDRPQASLRIEDRVEAKAPITARLAFHLDPRVECLLEGHRATLIWTAGSAVLDLADNLTWRLHRGETQPPLGWYSVEFGEKVPAVSLIGSGTLVAGARLETCLRVGASSSSPHGQHTESGLENGKP